MIIRIEKEDDYSPVKALNEIAFAQPDEAELVSKLRQNPDYIPELSLVAEENNKIIGHILFTTIEIVDGDQRHKSLALAPMSVLPEHQNKGVGSALIEAGFQKAHELGFASVIVLGHPKYYPRFGFIPAEQFNIHPPVEEWSPSFFAKELTEGSLKDVSGTVQYLPEFGI
jgi:putative acetyltransferase